MNNLINHFSFSNYSLITQIIIINLSTAVLGLFFIILFNFFLLTSSKNLESHNDKINFQIKEITNYLSKNAIKRILTFDDSCNRVFKENNLDCSNNNFVDQNYEDKIPQLDPTYTQQYIYTNFSNSDLIIKVFADNWIKFADTGDFYTDKEEIIILDINSSRDKIPSQKIGFYKVYSEAYFFYFNLIKRFFEEKKLRKQESKKIIHNDNITVRETIRLKSINSYIYKDQENNFKSIFSSPIIKGDKVYGVVIIDAYLVFDDFEGASQSLLLINFFLFFISIMFFVSLLFSKSIITPIKILSQNTKLERDKSFNNKKIINYPKRKDEIGALSKDIQSMSSDLKKRIIEIEEFASDVSHELKNPLAGLKSSSDLLKIKKLDEKNKELLLKNMGIDIDRMNILISDISNYSLTQVEISEEALEIIELINFLNKFKNSFSYKNYFLEVKSEENKIYIEVNKNKFIQVLSNLIDNAESFNKIKSKILIFVKLKNNTCVIHFVDQGFGIPLAYKEKIFERFYTDRQTNRNSHSGLGLSISKKIIESFGGSISLIESNHLDFQGACFEIKLPLKDIKKY